MALQIKDKINLKTNFESETVFKWTKQLLDGLDYLFEKNVIHRDIKPGYILMMINLDSKYVLELTKKQNFFLFFFLFFSYSVLVFVRGCTII